MKELTLIETVTVAGGDDRGCSVAGAYDCYCKNYFGNWEWFGCVRPQYRLDTCCEICENSGDYYECKTVWYGD